MDRFPAAQQRTLVNQRIISQSYRIHRLQQQISPFAHQQIMQLTCCHFFRNLHLFLKNNIPTVNLML